MFFNTNLKKIAIILSCLGILGLTPTTPTTLTTPTTSTTPATPAEPVPMPPDIVPEANLKSEDNKLVAPEQAEHPSSKMATSVPVREEGSVKVLEFVLAHQIQEREPKEILENFTLSGAQGQTLYAYARLSAKKPTQISFVWFKEGKEYFHFKANVQPSQRWRTYSSITLKPGDWKVQLVSESHEVLAEHTFTVQ